MKKYIQNKGITLISLVITVIILLILATVAITTAIDSNGLFKKANQAKEEMRYSQIMESKSMWEIEKKADKYTYEKTAGNASDVINKLYDQGTITAEERDKLLNGEVIIVAGKEIVFEQEGQLYLTLSKSYGANNEYAVVYAMPKIGGIPEFQTYEEYIKPQEVLATKDDAGKETIFVEYFKYIMKDYFEQNYPGQEITLDFILSLMQVASIEEAANMMGYNSVDEMLIEEQMIGYAEYQEYKTDYNANYKKYITITKPDGTTSSVANTSATGLRYAIIENGIYTFTATYEGQEVSKNIDITDIMQYKEMVLAKEDENTYLINSIEDLIKLSENVNHGQEYEGKTIKLMRSLDFNSDSSYENATDTTIFGDYNTDGVVEGIKAEVTKLDQRGFIPIGGGSLWIEETSQSLNYAFKGIFEGNSYEINNLHIENQNTQGLGLFGVNYGEIKNLKVSGQIKVDTSEYKYIGGITGYNYGIINNVENKVELLTPNVRGYIGGICGYNSNGTIANCKNTQAMTFESINQFGGIAGYHNGVSMILECSNTADITITKSASIVGGIIGSNYGYESYINKCYNTGNINGESIGYVGGIAGNGTYAGWLVNCYNTGNIYVASGEVNIGGIKGYQRFGCIANCYNTGTMEYVGENPRRVAGIIGDQTTAGKAANLINLGEIKVKSTGSGNAGGITSISYNLSYTKNIFNFGNLTVEMANTANVGSLTGAIFGTLINGRYLEGTWTKAIGNRSADAEEYKKCTLDELETILSTLNEEQLVVGDYNVPDNARFSRWKIVEGVNNGFPIFEWQGGTNE